MHGRSVTVTEVKETEGSTVKGKTVIRDMGVYASVSQAKWNIKQKLKDNDMVLNTTYKK